MFSKIVLIAIFAAIFCQISEQKKVKVKADYKGCGDDYQCFGLPNKCQSSKSCDVLLKTQAQQTGNVEFQLFWVRPANSTDSWVAAALSSDAKMGDDSATVFMIDANGTVTSDEGLTFINNQSAGFKSYPVKGIDIERTKYAGGLLSTKWSRTQTTTVNKETFDMKANEYYIFLAYGPVKDGKIQHHTDQGVSDNKVNLETEPTKPNTTTAAPTKATTAGKSSSTVNPTTKSSGTSAKTPSGSSPTAAPTVSPTAGNSTVSPTAGNSTEPSNSTTKGRPSTGHHKSTAKPTPPSGNASTITISIFLAIFAAILLIIN